jgi:flavin reductase (DIM6/NTAB) family NADH-FMN oxidoreductase RutF
MKKPWNLINTPIYSLATYNNNNVVNMNICTYVNAISMKPKKYAIAVYNDTQTLANIEQSEIAVLQLLSNEQYFLIKKLGQTSGINYNKQQYLTKKNLLELWQQHFVLKNTSARLLLKKEWSKQFGDHTLFVFDVLKYNAYNNNILMLNDLRERKLVRI